MTLVFPPKWRLRFYEQERGHLGGHYHCFICQQEVFKTMPKFRDTIRLAHASRLINTNEFVLLYDGNKPKNPDLPYTNYDHFDLDKITDDEWFLMVSTKAAKNIKQEQDNNFPLKN